MTSDRFWCLSWSDLIEMNRYWYHHIYLTDNRLRSVHCMSPISLCQMFVSIESWYLKSKNVDTFNLILPPGDSIMRANNTCSYYVEETIKLIFKCYMLSHQRAKHHNMWNTLCIFIPLCKHRGSMTPSTTKMFDGFYYSHVLFFLQFFPQDQLFLHDLINV